MAATRVIRSERFPDLGDEVLFPRLSDAKLAWLAERGERRSFQAGDVLYEHAVRDAPFYVIGAVGDGALVVRFAYEVLAG